MSDFSKKKNHARSVGEIAKHARGAAWEGGKGKGQSIAWYGEGRAYARSLGLLRREEPTSESLMRDVTDVAGATSGTFAKFRRDVAVGA